MENPFEEIKSELRSIKSLIAELSYKPDTKPKARKVGISIHDVSDLTGYTVNTIYSKVHKRTIPFHKSKNGGRKLIFFETEIRDWMQGKKETPEQAAERMEREFDNRS